MLEAKYPHVLPHFHTKEKKNKQTKQKVKVAQVSSKFKPTGEWVLIKLSLTAVTQEQGMTLISKQTNFRSTLLYFPLLSFHPNYG